MNQDRTQDVTGASPTGSLPVAWVGAAARRWESAGLISGEQARGIVAFEQSAAAAPAAAGGRLPVASEILAYLGSSLALVAAGIAVAEYWERLETWARPLLVATAAGVLLLAGWVLGGDEDAARGRLSAFLWFLSSAGVAVVVGLLLDDPVQVEGRRIVLWVSLATAGYAGTLWRLRRHALMHVGFFAAILAACIGAVLQPDPPPAQFAGLAVWGAGVAWAILSWGGYVPNLRVGYAVGALAMLAGAQLFSVDEYRDPALVLALATAAVLVLSGAALRTPWMLGLGAAGVFLFVPQAVFEYLGETLGAPIALFLTGVALLGLSVWMARLRGRLSQLPVPEVSHGD